MLFWEYLYKTSGQIASKFSRVSIYEYSIFTVSLCKTTSETCKRIFREDYLLFNHLDAHKETGRITGPFYRFFAYSDCNLPKACAKLAVCPAGNTFFFCKRKKSSFVPFLERKQEKKKNENDKMEAKDIVSFIQWYQFYDRSFERLLPESDLMEHLNCRIFC